MTFWERSGKTIIISLLSLLVAIITFGVLGSTGTFKNSAYDLGGSIVGFVVTVLLLDRIFRSNPAPEAPAVEHEEGPFCSEDTVQILDLRNQKPIPEDAAPNSPRNRVTLTELYRLKKVTDQPEITFHYATGGYAMEGKSLSHPLSRWVETTANAAARGRDKHLERQYEIRLNVRELARGELIPVENAVTYLSAFDGKEGEYFHTHVEFPTRSKCLILIFPPGQPCTRVTGKEQIGENESQEVDRRRSVPIIVDDGKVVYWRIDNPQLGVEYQLEWEWQNKVPTQVATS